MKAMNWIAIVARCILICVSLGLTACSAPKDTEINNDDIVWDGDDIGLLARVREHSDTDRASSSVSDSMLIESLAKDECWVAAHVLLSQRHGMTTARTPDAWNHLQVLLTPSGAKIDAKQQRLVRQFWESTKSSGKK